MNYKLLGEKVREQRKLKKLTLEQLAEKLEVSITFIGQIERAKGIPSLETLVRIANALEISMDYLLFGDLNEKAGDSHFINEVKALTNDFTAKEKQLILKNIEALRDYKKE